MQRLHFILLWCILLYSNDVLIIANMTTLNGIPGQNHHIISFVTPNKDKEDVENSRILISEIMLPNKGNGSNKLILDEPNTLTNTVDLWEEKNKSVQSNEFRRSIPVLEPVRHLLNTVRQGALNHTIGQTTSKHQLVAPSNESSAIETEEDRELVNESTELEFLDFAGRFGARLWGFLTNLQRLFGASSASSSSLHK